MKNSYPEFAKSFDAGVMRTALIQFQRDGVVPRGFTRKSLFNTAWAVYVGNI